MRQNENKCYYKIKPNIIFNLFYNERKEKKRKRERKRNFLIFVLCLVGNLLYVLK